MSLQAVANMIQDNGLIERIMGAAALAGDPQPRVWAANNIGLLASSEGWQDAYAAGLAAENYQGLPAEYASTVGANPNVITDAMIVAAVQALRGS